MATEALEAAIDVALYDESAVARDKARQTIGAQADAAATLALVSLLDAASSVTRRRAVQILTEIPPRRVRHPLIGAMKTPETSVRAKRSIARILTILADGDEPALVYGLQDTNPRIRRACATAAAPEHHLITALSDDDDEVVQNAAYALIVREAMPPADIIEAAIKNSSDVPESLVRLLARVRPQSATLSQMGVEGSSAALDHIKDMSGLRAIAKVDPVTSAWGLSRYEALDKSQVEHEDPRIRMAAARSLKSDDKNLQMLLADPDPGVRWMAQRTASGAYCASVMQARLKAPSATVSPSAKPPYGLRADNALPQVDRVHGALAICQARFNINLGVAMRSAEAAGLQEIIFVGRSDFIRSPARGADLAVPVSQVPDAAALIRKARRDNYQIVAIQQTAVSEPYHEAIYPPRPLFVVGSEDVGMPDELRIEADLVVQIPQFGIIDSLNVATAATVVVFHWRVHNQQT